MTTSKRGGKVRRGSPLVTVGWSDFTIFSLLGSILNNGVAPLGQRDAGTAVSGLDWRTRCGLHGGLRLAVFRAPRCAPRLAGVPRYLVLTRLVDPTILGRSVPALPRDRLKREARWACEGESGTAPQR